MKQTEDEIVKILIGHLKLNGWTIDSYCLGQTHGNDIVASKANTKLIVEAKGAKASNNSPTKNVSILTADKLKLILEKHL